MFDKIKEFIFHFLNRRKWKAFNLENSKDGELIVSLDVALKAIEFTENIKMRKISFKETKNIYFHVTPSTLYDLLYYLSETADSLEKNGYLSNKVLGEPTKINLYNWLKLPYDSLWKPQDFTETVYLIGDYIKTVYVNKGSSPDTYIERRLYKILDCYITLVEVLGDKSFTN